VTSPSNHRRAERIPFALRIRLNVTCQGILVDLSEGGALVYVAIEQPFDKQVTLSIDWNQGRVDVPARVVRCTPRHVELESATLTRKEYHVALEFLPLKRDQLAAIQQIIQSTSRI
jgi:hypothetical protein